LVHVASERHGGGARDEDLGEVGGRHDGGAVDEVVGGDASGAGAGTAGPDAAAIGDEVGEDLAGRRVVGECDVVGVAACGEPDGVGGEEDDRVLVGSGRDVPTMKGSVAFSGFSAPWVPWMRMAGGVVMSLALMVSSLSWRCGRWSGGCVGRRGRAREGCR
jgi:hypothetical protein